jgi:hypothetical protein
MLDLAGGTTVYLACGLSSAYFYPQLLFLREHWGLTPISLTAQEDQGNPVTKERSWLMTN